MSYLFRSFGKVHKVGYRMSNGLSGLIFNLKNGITIIILMTKINLKAITRVTGHFLFCI